MSLDKNWVDKVDGQDDILAEDINIIAQQAISNFKKIGEFEKNTKDFIKVTTSPDASGNILHIEDLPKGSLVLKGEFTFGNETIVFENATQCHSLICGDNRFVLVYFEEGMPYAEDAILVTKAHYSTEDEVMTVSLPIKNIEDTSNRLMVLDDSYLGQVGEKTYPSAFAVTNYIAEKLSPINNQIKTTNETLTAVESIAKGANQALSFQSYEEMINVFNDNPAVTADLNVGQNIMIVTLNVPDLWVYFNGSSEENFNLYTYTTDEAFVEELKTNGYVHVGFLKLSALETQKVDLTDVEKTSNKVNNMEDYVLDTTKYVSAKGIFDFVTLYTKTQVEENGTIYDAIQDAIQNETQNKESTFNKVKSPDDTLLGEIDHYPSMAVMDYYINKAIEESVGTVNAELESILAGGVD